MSDALAGGVFAASTGADEQAELRQLVDDIGRRSFEARIGQRSLPETFDVDAWQALEDTGLSRLTGTAELGAGPTEAAVVLRGLARHAVAVPVAETDLLAGWLAGTAGLALPDSGPLTVALGDADGTARDVPWTRACAAVVLAVRTGDGWRVSVARPEDLEITEGRNLAGEPRDTVRFGPVADAVEVGFDVGAELLRRGAWARCVQVIGALDAAAEMSVAHTRERVQFGRPLSKFQAVQHALARLAGEVERARAATTRGRRGRRPRLFQRPGRLRGDGGQGGPWARGSRRHHHGTSVARRDRGDDRASAVVGHLSGARLDRRVRQHRAARAAPRPTGAGRGRRRRRSAVGRADLGTLGTTLSCRAPR